MQIHQIFPTTILTEELGRPFTNEEMDFCVNSDFRPDVSTSSESPHSINLSVDHAVLENPIMSSIKESMMKAVDHYMFNIMNISDPATFYISRSWFTRSKKGDFGRRHNHPNSILSGVFYFKASPGCGNILFYDDKVSMFGSTQFGYKSLNQLNSTDVSVPPVPGTLILFPSRMAHEIAVNQSTETRYSLSFDIWVHGTIGSNAGGGTILTL